MKISSWNVNSVRARIDNVKNYLKYSKTDILMMQEIKTENTNFPFNDFKKMGFESYVHGQKKYNGIAILSKIKVKNVINDFINDEKKQSRILVSEIKNNSKIIVLINIYAPNGNPVNTDKYEYKKNWYKSFIQKIKKLYSKNNNIIIGGDFNVIPDKVDVYDYKKYENDALFKLEIRKKYRELINLGFIDVYRYYNKTKKEYTFWDYFAGSWQKNYGMRIDHFIVSSSVTKNLKSININKEPRSKVKPSDHTPVELQIT